METGHIGKYRCRGVDIWPISIERFIPFSFIKISPASDLGQFTNGRQSLPIRVGDGLNDHPLPTERLVPAGKPLLDQQLNKRSSRGFLMKSSKKISPCCFIRSIPAAPAFIGSESSVLPVNLPPSDPSPFRVLLIGLVFFLTFPAAFNVRSGGLPWVRRITSLYPVQLHFGSVRRILGLAHIRLLDLLPAAI